MMFLVGLLFFLHISGFFGLIVSVIINKFSKEWYMKYLCPIVFLLWFFIIYGEEGIPSGIYDSWKFYGVLINTIVGLIACIAIDIDNILCKDDK